MMEIEHIWRINITERSYLHMFLASSLQTKYPTQPAALSGLSEKKINLFLQSNLDHPTEKKHNWTLRIALFQI